MESKESAKDKVTPKQFILPIRMKLASLKRDPVLLAVIFLSFIFFLGYSEFSILKMYSLSSSGWDLGLQAQVMYTTLHGQLFYTNLLGFSLLQEHFSPFVFLILGVFWIHQTPITLLVLQAFFVSFASVPLYLFGRVYMSRLEIKAGLPESLLLLALVLSYLLSPLTQGLIFFDFHIMAFLPFFFFLSFYAFFSGRKLLNILSLALVVSLHSNFVFIAAMIIVTEYLLSYFLKRRTRQGVNNTQIELSDPNPRRKYESYLTVVFSFALLFVYLVLAGYAKSTIAGSSGFDFTFHTGEVGGYSSISGLAAGLFTNPSGVAQLFSHDYMQKLTLLYYAFGSTGFLSFLSPVALLTSIPYFLYSFLSTNTAYYSLGYQYPAMLIPSVFISSAVTIAVLSSVMNVKSGKSIVKKRLKVAFSILLVLLVAGSVNSVMVDPLSQGPLYHPIDAFNIYHDPNVGNSTSAIVFLSNNINKSANILTQNNLFPFFSTFPNSYSTPWSPGVNNTTISNFEYLIADYSNSWATASNGPEPSIASAINRLLSEHTYGIYAEGASVLAIKKGYNASPQYFDPVNAVYTPSSLHIDKGTILMNGSLAATNANQSFLWNGPYISLMPGTYEISYSIGLQNFSIGSYLNLDISSSSGASTFYNTSIKGNASSSANTSFLTLHAFVTLKFPAFGVEFRGYGSFNGTVFLNSIAVKQTGY